MQIKVVYISGRFTVLIPLLGFLLVWIGLPVFVFSLLRWQIPGWTIFLGFVGSLVLALAFSVFTYGPLMKLAKARYGILAFEDGVLTYKIGRHKGTIDLKKPHELSISAGISGRGKSTAQIDFRNTKLIIHLYGTTREKVLRVFPESYFIDELSVLPEEGLWGFVLSEDEPEQKRFFFAVLESAWQNREKNKYYQAFAHYPWHEKPNPAFRHIKVIKTESMTPEEKEFIDELLKQVVDRLEGSYVRATPHYLVGWAYKSVKSTWTGTPDYYFVMPIGCINVEVSLPRPDWKPFLIGNVILEALESLGGSKGSRIPLRDKRYLYIRGKDKDGKSLELAFDWYDLTSSLYEESERFVTFANR
ncbi:hypothetical protein ACSFC1_10015 [Pseudothermotoga sp. U03pept]|uniref:hypothetical protein n=1 Tax=Pseudothermotoga sp. U03pept TaxID=3447012 RepID=UPI003F0ECABD